MEEEIAVDEFKDLILEMYKGFPKYIFYGKVEKIIVTDEMREKLVNEGFLIRDSYLENGERHVGYMLGPAALPLVSSWKNEELANKIKLLTFAILVFTVVFGAIPFFVR
jgi:hypothetical protein